MKLNQPLRGSHAVWTVLTILLFSACWLLPIHLGKGEAVAYTLLIESDPLALFLGLPFFLIAAIVAWPLQYLFCLLADAIVRKRSSRPATK